MVDARETIVRKRTPLNGGWLNAFYSTLYTAATGDGRAQPVFAGALMSGNEQWKVWGGGVVRNKLEALAQRILRHEQAEPSSLNAAQNEKRTSVTVTATTNKNNNNILSHASPSINHVESPQEPLQPGGPSSVLGATQHRGCRCCIQKKGT